MCTDLLRGNTAQNQTDEEKVLCKAFIPLVHNKDGYLLST